MRKPSAATILAAIALFVSLGGAAVAASGTDFILGRNNTAKAKTSLTAPVAGNSLQITNTLPGGSALGLSVDPGSPPFTTNSSTKVPNLNSDLLDGQNSTAFLGANGTAVNAQKLDGLDSTQFLGVNATAANANKLGGLPANQFVQGGGSLSAISSTATAPPDNSVIVRLGEINGLIFIGGCVNDSGITGSQIVLFNDTGTTITVLRDGGGPVTPKVLADQSEDTDMPLQNANHFIWHGDLGSHGF